jgi:transposase
MLGLRPINGFSIKSNLVHTVNYSHKCKNMKNLFCGIDISKDFLDYAICNGENKTIIAVEKIENNKKGIKILIKHLKKESDGGSIWVCFEHTGNYGLMLASVLSEFNIDYSMVPSLEIIKSSGMVRGKTDAVDAKRIAMYLAVNNYKLKPTKLPSDEIMKIKTLLTLRQEYVKIRTQFKNSVKSLKISAKIIPLRDEIKQQEKEISRYDSLIKKIEAQIKDIIKGNENLDKNYKKITDILGIGLITASQFLVSTNNFTAFENPRKFNCYCGLAPFEYSSGTSVKGRTKTSHYRNKELKAALFKAANTAIAHDQEINLYFTRKISEGKHKMSVINAVACKLVYRVFAVVNRDEPYCRRIV